MPPKKAAGFKTFTFRLDDTLRKKAERLAKADTRPLGVWISLAIAEKVAEAERKPDKP